MTNKRMDSFCFSGRKYAVTPKKGDERWHFYRKKISLEMISNGKKVLDAGCYEGSFMFSLEKSGNDVYGIDASKIAINKLREKGLKVKVGNLEKKWPYKSNFFDIVYMGEVIEHIVDTDFLIMEAFRVLKKNGNLIITTPNLASLSKRILLLLGKNPYQEASFTFPTGAFGHLREYTYDLIKSFIESKGFQLEKFKSDIMGVPFLPLFLQKTLGIIFPKLGRTLILNFRKKS